MKKKILSAIAATLILAVCIACLVACNPYKMDAIGGGDASAKVESNGGYVVKQGNYVYFINGYVGADADATWGAATKQGIVRAEYKDGKIDNSTSKVLVPKSVYNSSANGGIAIFGEWVYYATPNVDKDKNGTASTTNTDFMRTKIDGSVTQLIGTIGTRSSEYLFTPSRVYYYESSKISYIDFSGMKTNKNIDNGKGAVKGTLAENVTSVAWKYDCNEFYYTQSAPTEESYMNYNNLCASTLAGETRTIATKNTYTENVTGDPLNVFKFSLVTMFVENDGSATLYYTKAHTLNGTSTTDGLFMAKASDVEGSEKLLNIGAKTTVFPLGFEEGALAYNNESVYCWYNGTSEPVQVTTTSQTVWYVKDGLVYFTDSSSAKALYAIPYKTVGNVKTVMEKESIKTDGLKLDFVGNDFFFFATDDDNYLHTINLVTFDKDVKDAESTYIGVGRPEKKRSN